MGWQVVQVVDVLQCSQFDIEAEQEIQLVFVVDKANP
jgi:hypothetical protein